MLARRTARRSSQAWSHTAVGSRRPSAGFRSVLNSLGTSRARSRAKARHAGGQQQQLSFGPRRRRSTPRRSASRPGWPDGLSRLDRPGLYSWLDHAGPADLSTGLGHTVRPGRIYAGQTGATKWPSGIAGAATLASRIGGSHLHGGIRGSTFRLTLTSCLLHPLTLSRVASRRLGPSSEERLSKWMRAHLEVAVSPVADRDPLAVLEHRVRSELNPPLNLDGMPPTALRSELSRQRAGLG